MPLFPLFPSLRVAVLGPSLRLQRQVGSVLFSASTYALYAAILVVQVHLGFADVNASVALVCGGLVLNVVFYALVRHGATLRGSDPALSKTQLIVGFLYMLVGYAVSGASAAAVLIVMASHIVYAVFTMPPRQVWQLVVASLAGLAATMLLCRLRWPDRFDAGLQLVSFLYAALVVPLIATLAHRLSAIMQRLRAQQQELQTALGRLEALATQDDLTGTHNRRHMTDLMNVQLEQQRRDGQPACVALLDIDLFKLINDSHGHAAGDEVLRRFARLTRESLRGVDLLARWGGEEFLVFLPGASAEQARAVLERVRRGMTEAAFGDIAVGMRVGFSAGVAALGGSSTLQQAVEHADQAMYRAKTEGRGRTELA